MYLEFLKKTVDSFNDKVFLEFTEVVAGEYLVFKQIKKQDITKDILIEKLADYFEIKAFRFKNFENMVYKYINCLNNIVSPYIPKEPKAKKGETVIIPRTRQYYDTIIEKKKNKEYDFEYLAEYTRIMLCLYMAIIDNEYKKIDNFLFSLESLDIEKILAELKSNKNCKKILYEESVVPDCTLIILLIMFFYIKNNEVED